MGGAACVDFQRGVYRACDFSTFLVAFVYFGLSKVATLLTGWPLVFSILCWLVDCGGSFAMMSRPHYIVHREFVAMALFKARQFLCSMWVGGAVAIIESLNN